MTVPGVATNADLPNTYFDTLASIENTGLFSAQAQAREVSVERVDVTTIVNDAGVTDNTAAIVAAWNLLPSQGGIVLLPEGKYGVDFSSTGTPVPNGVWLWGVGNGGQSTIGATTLTGVASKAGTQEAVVHLTNSNAGLFFLGIDAGTVGAGNAYGAGSCVIEDAGDCNIHFVRMNGGSIVAFNQTSAGQRSKHSFNRIQNQPTSYLNRNIAGATVSNGAATFTDASITSADVNRQVWSPGLGIPAGTYIASVSGTTATMSQNATTAVTSINIYQCDCAWLLAIDGHDVGSWYIHGVKRIGGGGTGFTNPHFTWSSGTNVDGLCNVILEDGVQMTAPYFDSVMAATGALLVHQIGARTTTMSNAKIVNAAATGIKPLAFLIENDTAGSVKLKGGLLFTGTTAIQFSAIVQLAGGSNPSLEIDGLAIQSNGSIVATAGAPTMFATGSTGFQVGKMAVDYNGVLFGYQAAIQSGFSIPATPVSTTVYQNLTGSPLYLSCKYTTTTSAGSIVTSIGATSTPATVVATCTPAITASVGQTTAIIPPGFFWKYVATNCTIGALTAIG